MIHSSLMGDEIREHLVQVYLRAVCVDSNKHETNIDNFGP